MKLKKYTISKELLKNLLDSNTHIGTSKLNTKNNFYYYLYGFRKKTSIINLDYTVKNLKQLFTLLSFFLKTKKQIIFVGFPIWFNKKWKFLEYFSKKNYFFFNYTWKNKNNYFLKNCKKIGLVFVFNEYSRTKELVKEVKKFSIPLAGFTSSNLHFFDYPIVGNFQSKKSIYVFFYFLFNILTIKEKT